MSRKVYAVQVGYRRAPVGNMMVPTINLSPAEQYGEVVPLLDQFADTGEDGTTIKKLHDGLVNVQPDDFVLPIGTPYLIGIACAIVQAKTGGVNLLRWNKDTKKYQPVYFATEGDSNGNRF